ncbi:MAG TPA: hypothetical protein VHI98_20035 [Vicinamibacterales bacterium]|jgi:hypothetical protein|nr:hypothetical protein [Vicinamibacterales bacterium]
MGWGGGGFGAVASVTGEVVRVIMDNETTSAQALKSMTRRELLRVIDRLREGNSELQEAALIWIDLYEAALQRERVARAMNQPADSLAPESATAA